MYFKRLRVAILLGMYGMSLHAMEGLAPAKKANPCTRGLNVYQKLAGAAKYPFKAIGSATFDGAWESARAKLQFDGGQKGMPVQGVANSSISHDAQLKEIVGSFFRALRDATDSHDKEAAGAQFMKNLFKNGALAIGELYNPDGEGREALRKIITTFKEFINEDGVIKELIEDMRILAVDEVKILFERFEELNLDGGAAKKAVKAAAET